MKTPALDASKTSFLARPAGRQLPVVKSEVLHEVFNVSAVLCVLATGSDSVVPLMVEVVLNVLQRSNEQAWARWCPAMSG